MDGKNNIIKLPRSISVRDLSEKINLPAGKVIGELIKNGVPATINEMIDFDIASIVLEEMGYKAEAELDSDKDEISRISASKLAQGEKRPPIVTVLGHVDHGKTTLLDAIRHSHIAEKETGGITQHISSYQIEAQSKGRKELITFLDTPGHEAFTTLRQRGASITDIAILIIAADDGVMPQTEEAIDLIKKAGVPMVVAINKIDASGANTQKVKQQLAEKEVFVEGWGGDIPVVEISAKEKIGIEDLLEIILLIADIKEFTANPNIPARGIVLDSSLDPKKGPLAVIIILDGTLKKGDEVIVGNVHGKIKKMENYAGSIIKEAGPSCPVVIMGLKEAAQAGEILKVEQKGISRSKIAELINQKKKTRIGKLKPLSAERFFSKERETRDFNIIIRADVPGSLEAITESIKKINVSGLRINILSEKIGNISQEDIQTAASSDAIVFGFNININSAVKKLAERDNVVVHIHNIIYELIDDLKECVSEWLGPEIIKTEIGRMKIAALFGKPKKLQIVGGKVIAGKVRTGSIADVVRENQNIGTGKIEEIRIAKSSVQECVEGNECGVKFTGGIDIQVGDILVFSIEEEKKRVL